MAHTANTAIPDAATPLESLFGFIPVPLSASFPDPFPHDDTTAKPTSLAATGCFHVFD
jgi:hypothetical protein